MTFVLSMSFEYYDYSWIARHTSTQNTQNMIFIWSTYFPFLKMFQYEKKEKIQISFYFFQLTAALEGID